METKTQKFLKFLPRLILWLSLALLCYGSFLFDKLPNFRDLTTLEFYYNLNSSSFDLGYVQRLIWNSITSLHILNPPILGTVFWAGSFYLGLILTRVFLPKVTHLLFSKTLPSSYSLLLSLIYVFNPWILERVLMGQYNVIRGHFLMLPVLYFAGLSFQEYKHKNYFLFCFWLVILSIVSTHHLIFLGIALLFYLIINKSKLLNWLRVLTPLIIATLARSLRYTNDSEFQYYNQTIAKNPAKLLEIVSSFSLKSSEKGNLIVEALNGLASWNTPTFQEYTNWKKDLGSAQNFLLIFNPNLQIIYVVSLVIILGIFLFRTKTNLALKIWLTGLSTGSLFLNFGLSNSYLAAVNKYFYSLPFSYSLREPGKFYSLFILSFVLILGSLVSRSRLWITVLLMFVSLNFTLSFLGINEYYQQVEFGSFYTRASQICQGQKTLSLPFDTYYTPSYSNDIYNVNTLSLQLNCQIIPIDNISVAGNSKDKIEYLSQSNFGNQVENLTTNICDKTKGSLKFLEVNKIKYLLLDTRYYPDLNQNIDCFKNSLDLKLQEGSLYLLEVSKKN